MNIIYDKLKYEYLDSLVFLDKICFTIPWSRNLFEGEITAPNTHYVIAVHENEVVGYGGVKYVVDEGSITNIAVHPQYRNQKIASHILESLINYSESLNLSVLMLELRESNEKALNLYKKYNFEIVGKRKGYYSDNKEDAILMTKYLTQRR